MTGYSNVLSQFMVWTTQWTIYWYKHCTTKLNKGLWCSQPKYPSLFLWVQQISFSLWTWAHISWRTNFLMFSFPPCPFKQNLKNSYINTYFNFNFNKASHPMYSSKSSCTWLSVQEAAYSCNYSTCSVQFYIQFIKVDLSYQNDGRKKAAEFCIHSHKNWHMSDLTSRINFVCLLCIRLSWVTLWSL